MQIGVYLGEKPLLKLIPRVAPVTEPDEDDWEEDEELATSVGTIV